MKPSVVCNPLQRNGNPAYGKQDLAAIAHQVERHTCNVDVRGSSPRGSTTLV